MNYIEKESKESVYIFFLAKDNRNIIAKQVGALNDPFICNSQDIENHKSLTNDIISFIRSKSPYLHSKIRRVSFMNVDLPNGKTIDEDKISFIVELGMTRDSFNKVSNKGITRTPNYYSR